MLRTKRRRETAAVPRRSGKNRTTRYPAKSHEPEAAVPNWLSEYQEMFPVQPAVRLNPTPDSFKIPSKGFEIPDFGSGRKKV